MNKRTLYYLDAYSDEVMPCGPTLDEWAAWLDKPDSDWRRPEAASDGDTFPAYVEDVTTFQAVWRGGKWEHPEPPEGAAGFFPHWGPGLGWDVDGYRDTLAECLADGWTEMEEGEVAEISATKPNGQARVVVTFRRTADGPRCTAEPVQ